MADPEAEDAQFVYDPETGVIDLQFSQWFDFQPFDTPLGYIERVTPQIAESVESRLGISSWHRRFYPDTPLHPSYAAFGGELPPLTFGVVASPPEAPLIEPVQSDEGLTFFRSNTFGTAIACMLLSILLSVAIVLYAA